MSDKTVVLHVGHGKTGSSFIQSSLALSARSLGEIGIAYPEHGSFTDAALGRITSGNGNYSKLNSMVDAVLLKSPKTDTVLYSYEGFFGDILDDLRPLEELIAKDIAVEIILFIRDPLDHAISVYAQHVKRGGYSHEFARYLASINVVTFVEKFIRRVQSTGASIHICNYSRHKGQILNRFAEMLGVPRSRLVTPQVATINRSLTRAELFLQRAINSEHLGRHRSIIADALCNELPNVRSEIPEFSKEGAEKFTERMSGPIRSCNELLTEDAKYSVNEIGNYDFAEIDSSETHLTFSKEQMYVISHVIASLLNQVSDSRVAAVPRPVGPRRRAVIQAASLFEIATKIERGNELCLEDARTLLSIAHRLRPGGKLIKAKLDSLHHVDDSISPVSQE